MTSIANAIMFYAFMKYAKRGQYPLGASFLVSAFADIVIITIISIGII